MITCFYNKIVAAGKGETEVIEASHGKMFRKYKEVMDVIKYSQ